MKVRSRLLYEEVDIPEERIITFTTGMMGFEEYKQFTLIFDSEKDERTIMWLQSVTEPDLAFPVIDPYQILPDYSPIVEDDWLEPLGPVASDEEYYLLVVLTVPQDLTKMTVNMKAPIVINTTTMKACQIIVGNDDYQVRYNIHDYVEKLKEGQ